MMALNKCVLGPGNRVDTLDLAPGSIVYGSSGTVYTDGSRDPDQWRIEVKDPVAVKVFGLPLSEPRLYRMASGACCASAMPSWPARRRSAASVMPPAPRCSRCGAAAAMPASRFRVCWC